MGVHGLWRLIEPSGKPVPLETLENKTLAVDVSIWLHQAVKGFQDAKGASVPNAHLLGIFHRVCKLLYFRIKPVFVFDGGVPVLKKQTIAKRNQQKSKNINEANRIQKQLISTLLKHSAVNKVITGHVKTNIENGQKKSEDMYALPPSQLDISDSSDEEYSTSDTTESSSPTKTWDLHTIDVKSANFRNLPADVRHEILTELKEMRKQNSWGRIHELPTQSDDFSGYQMNRLLKRFSVQAGLEEAEKEMGGATLSLGELETLLNDQGVVTSNDKAKRIASDENRQYILIKDLKKAMETARNQEIIEEVSDEPSNGENSAVNKTEMLLDVTEQQTKTIADIEYEEDLEKAIQLSLQDVPSTSKSHHNLKDDFSVLNEYDSESSVASEDEDQATQLLASAKNYMMEYSGLTPSEILRIITANSKKSEAKKPIIAKLSSNLKEIDLSNSSEKLTNNREVVIENNPKVSVINENLKTLSDAVTISELGSSSLNEVSNKTNEEQEIQESAIDNSDKKCQSETNETLEVVERNEKVELMSESDDSDDFVEVDITESKKIELEKNKFEIVIDRNTKIEEDDLFGDIFSNSINDGKTSTEVIETNISNVEKTKPDEPIIDLEMSSTDNKIEPTNKQINDELNKTESTLLKEVLNSGNITSTAPISTEQLKSIETNLMIEKQDLLAKQSMKERLATNITDQMYQEAQELLQLFGVPYVVAPMEAEAQCAFLDEMNLTDGTITDDSDIWLFGGKTVYKNFFNQSKRVLEYRAENIQHSFKLSRYEMILLALLVGSDYTTGVQGVGPVTALEILASFPPKKDNELILSQDQLVSGLRDFQKWITGDRMGPGRATLRNKLKNVALGDHFPSLQVVQAYLEPTVEKSDEQFSWGKPDLVSLIDYAKEKFGWNQGKSEEVLKPVLKRLNDTDVQTKITSYYQRKHKLVVVDEDKMSKRVKRAVEKIGKPESTSEEDGPTKEVKPKGKAPKKVEKKTKTKVEKVPKPKPAKGQPKAPKQPVEKSSSKQTIIKTPKTPVLEPEKTSDPELEDSTLDISTIIDEEIRLLQQTKTLSRKRVKQIENEMRYELENPSPSTSKDPKTLVSRQLHTKEVIPQKLREKSDVLKNKLKAIEVFRKSKKGPGYVPKRQRKKADVKDDAGLSDNSDS